MVGDDYTAPLDFAGVCAVILDVADGLPGEYRELQRRRAEASRGRGFPTSSSGGGGGGAATNRQHDFVTGKDGSGVPIPQHSDPVGELVVRDADRDQASDELVRAERNAYDAVCVAMRSVEQVRSIIARTRPDVSKPDAERARDNCWPCLDEGVRSEVVHDNAPNGVGKPKPRCRNHYEFFLREKREAPRGIGSMWAEGRRVTQQVVERFWVEERAAKAARSTKGRRR